MFIPLFFLPQSQAACRLLQQTSKMSDDTQLQLAMATPMQEQATGVCGREKTIVTQELCILNSANLGYICALHTHAHHFIHIHIRTHSPRRPHPHLQAQSSRSIAWINERDGRRCGSAGTDLYKYTLMRSRCCRNHCAHRMRVDPNDTPEASPRDNGWRGMNTGITRSLTQKIFFLSLLILMI